MDIINLNFNNLNFPNIILFFKFQSFPLLLNIIFLSFWLPLLFIFFYKKNKIFLYLSLAFLFLFIKEMMFFLSAKEIFSNVATISFLDATFNQLLLESLFFYLFSFSLFRVFQKIHLAQKFVYLDSGKLIKSVFLGPLGLIVVGLLIYASIVYFSEIGLLLLAFILLVISFKQNAIKLVERNYSFFNVPQIKKPSLIYYRIFLGIYFLIFLFLFYYLIIVFLEHEDTSSTRTNLLVSYLTTPQLLELVIEQYSQPVKSLAYFFLLFFATSLLRNFSFSENSQANFYEKADMIQQNFFSNLNEERLLFTPPLVLLKKSLIWLKEKLNIEYIIIHLPDLSIYLVVPPNYNNHLLEQSLNSSVEDYFPYIKEDILSEANQNKTFFYNNLLELSRALQRKFSDFIIQTNPYEVGIEAFVPANSLMSVPIFSSGKKSPHGHLIAVNTTKTYWEKDFDLVFLESFSKKLNVFLRYFNNYHTNKETIDGIVENRIDEKYINAIKVLEKKYNINTDTIIYNRDKIEMQISTLLEETYPNNFYFIREKEKEFFIFANYFLAGKKRNENIVNNLALLSGLSEEFISSNSSRKTLAVFMKKVNNFLSFLKMEENFISSLALSYNFTNRTLSFSNAAYRPLLSYNNKKDEFWSYSTNEGIPLGLKKGEKFEENKMVVNKGDIFFFLPQSILEKNARGERYDFDELYRLIRKNLNNPLAVINQVIKKNVEDFFGEKYPNSIIILVLKITH